MEIFSFNVYTFPCVHLSNWGYFERYFAISYELRSIFYDPPAFERKIFFVYELFGGRPAKLGSWKEFN